jgi:serralysin
VVGPDGTDTLTAVEFLQFDDQTIRLLPGTGVSVNFNTADPSIYQTAMNAIRDFDGNALGGNGIWLRIGQADVNGDGDIDQILVNRAIGRFATVGTAPDGLVYFSDFSWAGETRVAGIYIDPLVAAGIVQAGSDNDSQRRFQNDLQIENINRVLGADDYDNDGLQEVYFALTDGTAYLRALMEFDGNIRYANYQSQQEVIDYLTANGFGPETWAGWFTQPSSGEAGLGAEQVPAVRVLLTGFRQDRCQYAGRLPPVFKGSSSIGRE